MIICVFVPFNAIVAERQSGIEPTGLKSLLHKKRDPGGQGLRQHTWFRNRKQLGSATNSTEHKGPRASSSPFMASKEVVFEISTKVADGKHYLASTQPAGLFVITPDNTECVRENIPTKTGEQS